MTNYMLHVPGYPHELIYNLILKDENFNLKNILVSKDFKNSNRKIINDYKKINFITLENSESFLTNELYNAENSENFKIEEYIEDTNNLLNLLLLSQRFNPSPISINNCLSNVLLSLQWANLILRKFNPDKILFPITPHDLLGFSLYCVSKKRNIDIAIVKVLTNINDKKGFIINDIYDSNISEINLVNAIPFAKENDPNAFAKVENNIIRCLQPNYDDKSKEVLKKKKSFKNLKLNFFAYLYKFLFNIGLSRYRVFDFKKYELSIEESFELIKNNKKKILYFPLSFQPEVTSNPMTYPLFTTHASISIIRSILPENWILLIKEHPSMLSYNQLSYSNYRNDIVGELINKSKNCYLLNNKIKTSAILDISNAVLSGVGSAGIEALSKGLPVVSFGNSPYLSFPNVYNCINFENVRKALLEIDKNKENNSKDSVKLITYLRSLKPTQKALEFQKENENNNSQVVNWQSEYISTFIDLINKKN